MMRTSFLILLLGSLISYAGAATPANECRQRAFFDCIATTDGGNDGIVGCHNNYEGCLRNNGVQPIDGECWQANYVACFATTSGIEGAKGCFGNYRLCLDPLVDPVPAQAPPQQAPPPPPQQQQQQQTVIPAAQCRQRAFIDCATPDKDNDGIVKCHNDYEACLRNNGVEPVDGACWKSNYVDCFATTSGLAGAQGCLGNYKHCFPTLVDPVPPNQQRPAEQPTGPPQQPPVEQPPAEQPTQAPEQAPEQAAEQPPQPNAQLTPVKPSANPDVQACRADMDDCVTTAKGYNHEIHACRNLYVPCVQAILSASDDDNCWKNTYRKCFHSAPKKDEVAAMGCFDRYRVCVSKVKTKTVKKKAKKQKK